MITYSAVNGLAACVFLAILALTPHGSFAADYNGVILEQVKQMPQGGRYSVSHFAKIRLQSSAHFESGKFFIVPAGPSFCSGATYLVFIRTIEALRARGELHMDYATLEKLIIRDQRDGEGIWGRWNANGPGTARLFHELQLGRNFDNFDQASPGDFMKIFWSRQVGKMSTDTPQFFSEWRIDRTASMSGIGRVTFQAVTVRNLFREARLRTQFFRVFRHLRIWHESITRLWSTRI